MLTLRESVARTQKLPRDEEILIGRAALLEARDQDLIKAVLIHNQSASSVARLAGVSPKVIRTRIRALTRRLTSRRFLDAARAMPYLKPEDAAMAKLRFCQCLPQRRISAHLGLTCHAVRRRLDRIAAEIAMLRRVRRADELLPEQADEG